MLEFVTATAEALSQQKWIWSIRDRTVMDLAVFDRATRGPWGAILLMFRVSTISYMGLFGSVTIVFAIAIGPFAQQIVRFETCYLSDALHNATTQRLGYFTSEDLVMTPATGAIITDYSFRDYISAGVFAPQSNEVPVICPSRNCMFSETFSTIASCTTCEDVSDQLLVNVLTSNTSDPRVSSTLKMTYNVSVGLESGEILRNNFTGIRRLDGPYPGTDYYIPSVFEVFPWPGVNYSSPSNGPSVFTLISFNGLKPRNCTAQDEARHLWWCRGYGAARCNLYPCVHTYALNVSDGVVSEQLLKTYSDRDFYKKRNQRYTTLLSIPCLAAETQEAIKQQGYTVNASAEWLVYNSSLSSNGHWYDENDRRVQVPQMDLRCLYQVHVPSFDAIKILVGHAVEGTVPQYGDGPAGASTLWADNEINISHINSVFNNISKGITTRFRRMGNQTRFTTVTNYTIPTNISDIIFAPNQLAEGIIMEQQTCVTVRWGWLAFPASMILLAITFLALTMMDTSLEQHVHGINKTGTDSRVPSRLRPGATWKSSALPMLFHGLDNEELRRSVPDRLAHIQEMEDRAKSSQARLAPGNEGWKLTTVA